MNMNERIRELTSLAIAENLHNHKSAGVTLASIIEANFDDWEKKLKPTCQINGIKYPEQIQKILAAAGKEVSIDVIIQSMSRHRQKLGKVSK